VLSENRKKELRKRSLADLLRLGEPKFTDAWFPYTSGEVGPYYVQSVTIEKDGEAYARAVDGIAELIVSVLGKDGFDVVSGGESRDWDFSNPTAYLLRKPHAKLYKNGKVLGADLAGKRVVHVADLNNEGSSIRDYWYPIVKEKGGSLMHVFFFIDRMEEGVRVLNALNLPSESLVAFEDDAWRDLLSLGAIDESMYRSLMARNADRRSWAEKALKRRPDILGDMLTSGDGDTVARAWKILDVGYPHLKEELLAALVAGGYAV